MVALIQPTTTREPDLGTILMIYKGKQALVGSAQGCLPLIIASWPMKLKDKIFVLTLIATIAPFRTTPYGPTRIASGTVNTARGATVMIG